MRTQYRVTWQRVGREPKHKTFSSVKAVRRFLLVLGPEPWRGMQGFDEDDDPDEPQCCYGRDCGCEGVTWREASDARRKELDLQPLAWVRLESRPLHNFVKADWPDATRDALNALVLQEPTQRTEATA